MGLTLESVWLASRSASVPSRSVAAEGREAQVGALRPVAPQDGANERAAEGQGRLEHVGDAEGRERVDGATGAAVRPGRGAEGERRLLARVDAKADEDAGRFAARVQGQAPLPGVEGTTRELDEALRHQEGMAVAQVDRPPPDVGADAAAEEQRVQVGALDCVGERRLRARAHRELGAEGQRDVAIQLDHDGRRGGNGRLSCAAAVGAGARFRSWAAADTSSRRAAGACVFASASASTRSSASRVASTMSTKGTARS